MKYNLSLIIDSDTLRIPREYVRFEQIVDSDVLLNLHQWKRTAESKLAQTKELLEKLRTTGGDGEDELIKEETLTDEDQALVVMRVAPFTDPGINGNDDGAPWTSPRMRELAKDILSYLPNSSLKNLLARLLLDHLKPLFAGNPHPRLNINTGRRLPRAVGGDAQDFYDSQKWKEHVGVANVVQWCVNGIKSEMYDDMWHLIIPPVMALLDDYEAKYKLRAVWIVNAMLDNVPGSLLVRTGVDELLRKSLRTVLAHLQNPETPALILSGIRASLQLVKCTTRLGSAAHFEQLCALLGEGIIGSVWMYADDKPAAMCASIEALPAIMRALGIGCTRYLKALIPQLVHPLFPRPFEDPDPAIRKASLKALIVIIEECEPRMCGWRATILDGTARRWVSETQDAEERQLLQKVCERLAKACPSIIENEYTQLLNTDHVLFGNLLNHVQLRSGDDSE